MFGGKHKAEITEYAKQMADIITGALELEADPYSNDTKDERAYLQGYRCIEHLNLKTIGSRRLVTSFRDELIDQGLPADEAMIHMLKFWVFYWTMMVGSTEGVARRFSLKQVQRSEATLAKYQ